MITIKLKKKFVEKPKRKLTCGEYSVEDFLDILKENNISNYRGVPVRRNGIVVYKLVKSGDQGTVVINQFFFR